MKPLSWWCVNLTSQVLRLVILCAVTIMLVTVSAGASCTLYASPSGNSSNSGTSPSSPLPLKTAANRSRAGDVVCLMQGNYYVDTPLEIYNSGSSSRWIVYTNYNGAAAEIRPKSGSAALFRLGSGVRYVEINGLQFEGQNTANVAIGCSGCNHARFIANKINHMGSAGIATYPDASTGRAPDYITADHNQIYHCGYNQGWSSGVSYLSHRWSDSYQGFHSFVTNNIISGEYDNSVHRTDGNGIVLDDQPGGANTPPTLIANNVVYQNGRRCIVPRSSNQTWMVNNTCYKNGLDKMAGDFQLQWTAGTYVVNNISYAWNDRLPYLEEWSLSSVQYSHNLWLASGSGTPQVVPLSLLNDPAAFNHANPVFVNPPYVSATGQGQYNNAVPPDQITNQFYLNPGSPAIAAGIDPTTIPGISSQIVSGLQAYVFTDINGKPRLQGSHFDLGAYVYTGSTSSTLLNPTADTYVDSAHPTTNYGSSPQLRVGNSVSIAIAYLKFDLSSMKSVTSAHLRLWVYQQGSGTYSLSPVSNTSWTESGTTYANRPSNGAAIGSVTDPKVDTWIDFDVTGDVGTNLGHPISFAISTSSSHNLYLDSREVRYLKPQLLVSK